MPTNPRGNRPARRHALMAGAPLLQRPQRAVMLHIGGNPEPERGLHPILSEHFLGSRMKSKSSTNTVSR